MVDEQGVDEKGADEKVPLNYESARGMEKEQAAFFYRGASEEVAEGVIFTPRQGNSTAFVCDDAILMVDTNPQWYAAGTVEDIRKNHSKAPVDSIIYTHGHIDHVTGAETFIEEAASQGYKRPRIIGHEDVSKRFERYRQTHPWQNFINRVQFNLPESIEAFSTVPWIDPDTVYTKELFIDVGKERFELHHSLGETDDETWVWCPGRRVLCTGDTFVWSTPNGGNPYKVQRYAYEWAVALEMMAAQKPLHLLPGHGPAMSGEERIQDALLSTANFLRSIHDQVVAKMNEGKWLEDVIREIDLPVSDKPWLRPIYDHPEFIARNVYRLYGGWYDGDPANILPAHSEDVASALVSAAGAAPILERARKLQSDGELQLACHLVDFVRKGEPDNAEAWKLWRDLFAARAAQEQSLMARGAFYYAVSQAEERLEELG
ncbi:MAG: MBL fold metallo-hydrolase [Chloroflexi bacterium]|nr:MBL fold metallo-hydrolase [Chloroflexota bacterium]